jgi:uncharacterized protein (TIRG00374 family)
LIWLVATTNWAEVWTALALADYRLVFLAVALVLITIPMRAARWRLLFPGSKRPPMGLLIKAMLVGQSLNVLGPARLGDLVKAALVDTEHPAFVLGTQLVRLVLDLCAVGFLVLILTFQVRLPYWWRGPGELLQLTAALALIGLIGLILGRRQLTRLVSWIGRRLPKWRGRSTEEIGQAFVRCLEVVAKPTILPVALLWTAVIWAVYGTINLILLGAVGEVPEWPAAFFVLVILQLGIAVPSSPGRIGVFHYLSVQALAAFGIERSPAVSFAVILHLASVMLPIVVATLLIWRHGIST